VWINNAMITVFATIVDTRPHELHRATEVTYFGQVIAENTNITVSQVHTPAMNTHRFGSCRARTDTHPMSVPPIYQPDTMCRGGDARARRWHADVELRVDASGDASGCSTRCRPAAVGDRSTTHRPLIHSQSERRSAAGQVTSLPWGSMMCQWP
jgi:hypothetical protein